jgi:beta-glucosidase
MRKHLALPLAAIALAMAAPSAAQEDSTDPDVRAAELVAQMTRAEKLRLVHGHYPNIMDNKPDDVPQSAGYVPGIPRLEIPAQRMTDASLGVSAAHQNEHNNTALPSGLAIAATFDPRIARLGGETIGSEARTRGFNVMLAGGVNLTREPRGGRNFEYAGEDALLAGTMVGQSVAGIQSNDIVATTKHFALNAQDSGRDVINVVMDEKTMRESDLLAFQKVIEIADPGAIMCAYNLVNGDYACESEELTSIARDDWGWDGWMMSDWGAVYSTVKAVNSGLDQEMGEELDQWVWFGDMLGAAIDSGALKESQLDAMVTRILRSYFAHGVMDNPVRPGREPDLAAHAHVPLAAAQNGIVLLKNEGNALPLAASAKSIAVIGGAANLGVYSGGGSSQVKPEGIVLLPPPVPAPSFIRAIYLHPSAPLDVIRDAAPDADIAYDNGRRIEGAVAAARDTEVAIVFATQFTMEGQDAAMVLDDDQDALIAAVAAVNPNTIVVLETGGAVKMPWLDNVRAVVEAWYPGARGGEAIADVLFGKVNPSGRLPITFPADESQLPNPVLPGSLLPRGNSVGNTQPEPFDVTYPEGADIGYRWFAKTDAEPLFPFGFGLSYTSFAHGDLTFDRDKLSASFSVINSGAKAGTDTPQLYLTPPNGQPRLVGWARAELGVGESGSYSVALDPRFAASFDVDAKEWVLPRGRYSLRLAASATDEGQSISFTLPERRYAVDWRPEEALAIFDASD